MAQLVRQPGPRFGLSRFVISCWFLRAMPRVAVALGTGTVLPSYQDYVSGIAPNAN